MEAKKTSSKQVVAILLLVIGLIVGVFGILGLVGGGGMDPVSYTHLEKDFISSRCYTLLSYLAVTAGNRATANQLALILWPDESCEIPMKSVRNIAYRLRSLLGYVGLEDLVVYANGIFSFNPEIKVVTDVGLFEELCDSIEMENNPKKRYRLYEAAVGLYSGNLLPRLSDNIYFIPSITYYQGLYFRLAGRYIERQTECGEYVYAHKAAKAALAFDPFNSSLNMHLTILLYQQSGAGTANAFYTGIKRHLTEAHIQRIKQTCPNTVSYTHLDDDGGAYGGQRQVMADPEAQGGGRAPGRERARDRCV